MMKDPLSYVEYPRRNPPMGEGYRIISAEFVTSAFSLSAAQQFTIPECAFIGRSNVGKSSLLNALCGQKSLAKTSKTPGRTQSFNYFQIRFINTAAETPNSEAKYAHFVDLPGYGYAKVDKRLKSKWPEMIENYLIERETLCGVMLLVDSRRDLGQEERWIAELGASGNLLIVLTKIDKLSRAEQSKRKQYVLKELDLSPDRVVLTSSTKGKQQGLEVLTQAACSWLVE